MGGGGEGGRGESFQPPPPKPFCYPDPFPEPSPHFFRLPRAHTSLSTVSPLHPPPSPRFLTTVARRAITCSVGCDSPGFSSRLHAIGSKLRSLELKFISLQIARDISKQKKKRHPETLSRLHAIAREITHILPILPQKNRTDDLKHTFGYALS